MKSPRSFVAQRGIAPRGIALARFVAACSLILGVVACRSHKDDAPRNAAPKAPIVVAPPAGLAGELKIIDAKQLWPALQPLGPTASPLNAEILLANLLGLPVLAADLLALDQPIHAVILSSGTKLPMVFGIKVRHEAELLTLLTAGSASSFAQHKGAAGALILRHKANPELPLLMLKQGTLLASSDEPALLVAAAYLSQPASAPEKTAPGVHVELNQIALKKGLIEPIQSNWLSQQQSLNALMQQQAITRGRPADLADPGSALASASSALTEALGVVGSLNAVKADLRPKADGLEIQAEFDAVSGGAAQAAIARFTPGALDPLGALPTGVRLAVLSNNEETDPKALGDRIAAGLSDLFAQRIPVQQARLIGSHFQDLAVALSGPCIVGWLPAGPDSGGFLLAQLADGKAFARAIEGIVRLVEVPAVKQVLANWIGPITLRPVSGGFELRFHIPSDAASNQKPGAGSKKFSVLWRTQGDRVYLALGSNAAVVLAQLMAPEQRIGDQTTFSRLFETTTDRPSLALMALGPSDGADRAGLSVVLAPSDDKSGDRALLRARFSRSMLQAMLQQLSGRN